MGDAVLGAVIGGVASIVGIIIGVGLTYWQTHYQAKQAQHRDRIAFLTETLKQLAIHYGDARKFLYLEDAGQSRDPESVSDFAKTLGAFTALALSVNDEEINKQIASIWIPRLDNAARGTVQQTFEDIISRLGNLINEVSD